MRKILGILILVVFGVFLTACTEFALDTPNVTRSGDMITWDAVEGATQYYVYIDDDGTAEPETNYYSVSGTSYDLTTASLADGTYSVYVVAVSGTTSFSANSTVITYVVGGGDITLDAPTVTLTGDTLSWDAVTDATGYTIYIGTTEVDVTATTYDLTQQSLAAGTYTIYVVATADTVESADSNTVSYEVVASTTLDAPTVTLTGDTLSWDAVTDADSYVINIGTQSIPVTGTSYDLSQLTLTPDDYTVTVVAVDTAGQSPASTSVTYTISSTVHVNAILAGVLPIIDAGYTVGMVESDFSEPWEYGDYQMAVIMATSYANASFESGLPDADAIAFFQAISDLAQSEDNFDSIQAFLTSTDIFETNQITPEIASHLLMSVLSEFMTIQMSGMSADLGVIQSNILVLESELTPMLANADYVGILTMIANHVPITAADTALMIANGGEYAVKLVMKFIQVTTDRQNDWFYSNDYYYEYDLEDEHVDDIIAIVIEIENSEDAGMLSSVYLVNNHVLNIYHKYNMIQETLEDIEELTMILDRLDDLAILMTSDLDTMEAAVETIFDFMMTMHDLFPQSVVDKLDDVISGESVLTTAEIITIKNELVALVTSALPEEEEFQMFFEAILMIGEVALGNPISDLEAHADYFGSVDYHAANVGLLFLGDISLADVGELMLIIDGIQVTYIDNEISPLDNPEPLLDAIDFLTTYVDTFKADHPTEVADLEALLNADAFEPFYQEVLAQLVAFATEQDPEDIDMILYILDALSNEYDNIINVLGIVPDIATGMFDVFMTSEASILTLISSFEDMSDPTLEDIITAIEAGIDEVALYHDVFADEFTLENIESVLSILVVPAMIESGYYMDELGISETAIRALIPTAAQLILNVATLEGSLFDEIELLSIGDFINMTNGFAEPVDLGSALLFIHLLDAVLTTENETLIDDTIELFFTTILGNSTVQSLLQIDPNALTDIRTNIESGLSEFKTAVHTFAALDYTTLTPEQEASIMQFAYEMGLYIDTELDQEAMMANATVIHADVINTQIYRTDALYYAFTPTTSGYYEFVATFDEMLESYMQVEDASGMWITYGDSESVTNKATHFLEEGMTYYILLEVDDYVYVDVDMEVGFSEDVVDVTLDVEETIDMSHETYIFSFEPTVDDFYEIVIAGDMTTSANIHIIDTDLVTHAFRDYNLYDNERSIYVEGVVGTTIYIEISTHDTDAFTLLVRDYDATVVDVDTSQTVVDNTMKQSFVFTVDTGAYYDLRLTSTENMNFDLYFGENDAVFQNANFEINNESFIANVTFLRPNVLYRIEVNNMSIGSTFDFIVEPTMNESLDELTPVVQSVSTDEQYVYSLSILEAGLYDITYEADIDVWFWDEMYNEDGRFISSISGDIYTDQSYHREAYLTPGTYYVAYSVSDNATVTLSLSELVVPEVYSEQSFYVELMHPDETYIAEFTPGVSGEYHIYSFSFENEYDPYITIWLGDVEHNYDDDSGDALNFDVIDHFDAGMTYTIYINMYDEEAMFDVMIEHVETYMD